MMVRVVVMKMVQRKNEVIKKVEKLETEVEIVHKDVV